MRRTFPLFITLFLDNFGFGIALPTLASAMLRSNIAVHSHPFLFLALLIALFPLGQFFGAPFLGRIADFRGRRKAFIVSLSISIFGYLLTALAFEFSLVLLLFFGRLISGFAEANRAICLSAITDLFENEKPLRNYFGFLSSIEGISLIIGILTGGFLSSFQPLYFALPFWVITFLVLINLLFIFFFFTETKKAAQTICKISQIWKACKAKKIFLIYFFIVLSWMTILLFNSGYLILKFQGTRFDICLSYFFILAAWWLGSSVFHNFFSTRMHPLNLLTWSVTSQIIGFVIAFFSPSFFFYLIIASIVSCLLGISWPATLSLSHFCARKEHQGLVQGLNLSFGSFGLFIGSIIIGLIVQKNINILHLFAATSSFLALFIIFLQKRNLCHGQFNG